MPSPELTKRIEALRGINNLIPESERHKYSIKDLKKGGYFTFKGQIWKVVDMSFLLYVGWEKFKRKKEDYWVTELTIFSLKTGETRYIEWEEDDILEVSLTEKKVKLRELGVSFSDLAEMADEEEGYINFGGQEYEYIEDDSWAALWCKYKTDNGIANGIPVRIYEFEADREPFLSVEAWQESIDSTDRPDREAFTSVSVNPKDISVIQISA